MHAQIVQMTLKNQKCFNQTQPGRGSTRNSRNRNNTDTEKVALAK